jgi:NAD(P)-dependent dehydrogenase (short-subunit alcohol dehydrogenase family)
MDLNKAGIRVNMVCPTWVDTPMFEEETRRVPLMPDLIKNVTAIGRPMETDEVAAAVQYLCSPMAAYITGSSIMMDNGMAIGPRFGM